MRFIKIKAYEFNMDGIYDLFLNLHSVVAFYETIHHEIPCVKIELLSPNDTFYYVPLDEFERLKNSVISPFCGDV